MSSTSRLAIILVIVLGGVVLDQATKWVAIRTLSVAQSGDAGPRMPRTVIAFPKSWSPNDLFRFQYAENEGAFLSMFSTLPDWARFWILTGLNSAILLVVALFLGFKRDLGIGAVSALSLILSGGIGNIIDRIWRDGRVVDFMNMGIGLGKWSLRTGIFNIADLAIVGGLVLLVAIELFAPKQQNAEAVPEKKEGRA